MASLQYDPARSAFLRAALLPLHQTPLDPHEIAV